jgi:hypothetical protein
MNKKRPERNGPQHPMTNLAEIVSVDILGRFCFISPITSEWEKKSPNVFVSAREISVTPKPGLFVRYEKIEKGPRGLFATGVSPL